MIAFWFYIRNRKLVEKNKILSVRDALIYALYNQIFSNLFFNNVRCFLFSIFLFATLTFLMTNKIYNLKYLLFRLTVFYIANLWPTKWTQKVFKSEIFFSFTFACFTNRYSCFHAATESAGVTPGLRRRRERAERQRSLLREQYESNMRALMDTSSSEDGIEIHFEIWLIS